jgi:hypothetical protein
MSGSHKADPRLIPDIEAFKERAAIAQSDGGADTSPGQEPSRRPTGL